MTVFTPETLAERWSCSPRHVRNLIRAQELRAFKLGGKLTRIPLECVEEYECKHLTPSADSGESASSSSTRTGKDIATVSELQTRARLHGVRRGLYAAVTKPAGKTISELWEAYCADKAGRAVVTTMGHTWKALRPIFAAVSGDDVSVEHCRLHTARRRAAGIKDGTIHTELGHVRMVLVWAAKYRHIPHASFIERPAKPAPKDHHLTKRQAHRLIHACEMPHLKLFVHLALGTGARSAALFGLKWKRVDFAAGLIDLRDPDMAMPHKGRAVVPMTRTLRAALQESGRLALTPYVIEWAGKPVASVKKGLAAAAARAKLPKVSAHMLRHSAAVHMAEARVPMEEIAQYLGHEDVKVTRSVYARFSPDYLREAAGALEYDDLGSMDQGALRWPRFKTL